MEYATCHLYFGECVYEENTSDKWHIPRYPTRKHCITSIVLYYIILYRIYYIKLYCIYDSKLSRLILCCLSVV